MDPNAYKHFHPYTGPEISSLSWDPDTGQHIPFRASARYKHSTWARTNHCRPELYVQPTNEAELRLVVDLARRRRKQLIVVGSGHSPSDITCTPSWIVNLDHFCSVVSADEASRTLHVQAGMRLHQLCRELDRLGWAMPNLGSIVEQSIAGAISTSTHGSSLRHGLLSDAVVALTLMLADGSLVTCSPTENSELFRAALVSLGGLGIITHVAFRAVPAFKIEWEQEVLSLPRFLKLWDHGIWTQSEFVRCWWFPYTARIIVWHGSRSDAPLSPPPTSWYGAWFGRFTYELLLYFARWFPQLMPQVEKYVFSMQYGLDEGVKGGAVEKSFDALTMDCLFPQLVNEWAIPLDKGPEAITRLQHWFTGSPALSGIPISPSGVYVHAPIEVRVSNTSLRPPSSPRPFLDQSVADGPTLYLNATLYRPFLTDIPKWEVYYQAFEHLMLELGGKPHWAKNFVVPRRGDFERMYGENLWQWRAVKDAVDRDGVFGGEWLRRNILDAE